MTEAFKQLFDGTCPICCGDEIEYVKNVTVKSVKGSPSTRQLWHCQSCNGTFTVNKSYVLVAEYNVEGIVGGAGK